MKKMRREVLKGVVIFGICCILLSSGMLAEIVFKQGTDGEGQSWDGPIEVVKNSNGKCWELTRANVQSAIDDLVSSPGYGSVWVGGAISMDGTPIYPKSNILVDFGMNKITFASDGEFINLTGGCRRATVQNAYIVPYAGTDEGIITVYADGDTAPDAVRFNVVRNINIVGGSSDKDFIGIELKCVDDQSILDCHFEDIYMNWAGTGIQLECTHAGGFINGNIFDNVYIDYFETGINIKETLGLIEYNEFNGVRGQVVDSDTYSYWSQYGLNVSGTGNVFNDFLLWDWYMTRGDHGVYYIHVTSDADDTVLRLQYYDTNSLDEGDDTYIEVNGGELHNAYDKTYIIGEMYGDDTDLYLFDSTEGRVVNHYDNIVDTIEQALNLKGSGTAVIYIKEGNYNVDNAINHDNMYDVDIIGAGKTKTIFNQSSDIATYQSMFYLYSTNHQVENVLITGIGFNGNSATISDGGGIRIRNGKNITIKDCSFTDTDDFAITSYQSAGISNNIDIYDNIFHDITSYGVITITVSAGTHVNNLTIRNNIFLNNTVDNIWTDMADSIYGLYIYENRFSGCTADILDQSVAIGNMYNFRFTDNVITDTPGGYFNWTTEPANKIIKDNLGYNYDSLQDNKIWNSNGNYYPTTESDLQEAIDDAGDNGWVTTPAGKISVTGDVYFNEVSNFTWISYGTELEVTDSTSFAGGGLIVILDCNNLHIEGLELDGNHPWNTSASDSYAGVNIRKCSNSTFSNLEIHHVLGDGVLFQDATESTLYDENSCNNIVTECNIHHIGDVEDTVSSGDAGIRVMGSSNITDNTFSYNRIDMIREHGIKIYGYTIVSTVYYYIHDYNRIIGNTISNVNQGNWDLSDNVYGVGITCGSEGALIEGNTVYVNKLMEHGIGGSDFSSITNNHIIFVDDMHSQFYGIYVQNSVNNRDSFGVSISGNHIDGQSHSNTGGIALVGSANDVENVTVINNHIRNVSYFGINLDSGANHCDISHNEIFGCYAGVRCGGGDYNIFSENKITKTSNDGMMFDDSNYCEINGNIMSGVGAKGIDLYGTFVHTSISYNQIASAGDGIDTSTSTSFQHMDFSHNHIINNWNYAMLLDNVGNSTISFNHLSNSNADGLQENSNCAYNIFIGNNAEGSANAWDMNGVGSVNCTNIPAMT